MSYTSDYVLNEENIASFLKDAVSKVESANDSEIKALEQIKKLIKKNIPFTRRKYVFAYLIKQSSAFYRGNKNSRFAKKPFEKKSLRSESAAERKEKLPRVHIDASVSDTLFIGIGKNRSVFPRDIVGLLTSVCSLDPSRIGEIRILSNYSFVQLFKEDCDKVIAALNGYEFRGRKLTVNLSKKKEDFASSKKDFSEDASVEKNEAPVTEEVSYSEEIPANVTNEAHADTSVNVEEENIVREQAFFAQSQSSSSADVKTEEVSPFSETTDDGQVKSHFGDGAAY